MNGLRALSSPRHGPFLAASAAIIVAASLATHLAGVVGIAGEGSEGVEHGTSASMPAVVGPLAAMLILGVLWLAKGRVLRPAWFLVLPPAAFVVQEVAERLTRPPEPEPSLVATALVQLIFALLAFLLARLVLTAVRRFMLFLADATARSRVRVPTRAWPPALVPLARRPAMRGAHLGRAPPDPI